MTLTNLKLDFAKLFLVAFLALSACSKDDPASETPIGDEGEDAVENYEDAESPSEDSGATPYCSEDFIRSYNNVKFQAQIAALNEATDPCDLLEDVMNTASGHLTHFPDVRCIARDERSGNEIEVTSDNIRVLLAQWTKMHLEHCR